VDAEIALLKAVMQVVSTIGFPIAICLILLWFIKDMLEKHKDETNKFTESLNNNTLVLQRVCDMLSVKRNGDD
jgi:hypothetical protein